MRETCLGLHSNRSDEIMSTIFERNDAADIVAGDVTWMGIQGKLSAAAQLRRVEERRHAAREGDGATLAGQVGHPAAEGRR